MASLMHNVAGPAVKRPTSSILPIKDEDFGYAQARHLLLRAGFGGTDEQIRTLVSWGAKKAVDHLVNYDQIDMDEDKKGDYKSNIIRPLSRVERQEFQRARQSKDQDVLDRFQKLRQRAKRDDRKQMREIQRAWLTRMVQTPRPLEEKMTLFWHGHFATSYRVVEDSYHMYMQNRMLRQNAMGNVADLLTGIIHDPAMLKYLNNNQNRKQAPNENLGRELMELFSLGEGNYTERDIKEGARTLTGYTFDDDQFVFNKNQHDEGIKHVLGVRGNLDGDSFVSAILNQNTCAIFLCLKLYRFFVRDIPMDLSQSDPSTRKVVLQLAQILQKSNYSIGPVVRYLLMSRHFYDPINVGTKIKSPSELLIGAVRSLNVPARDIGVLSDAMELMGQSVYMPPSVKGWDGGRSWINTSTMFVRQNTLIYLLTGQLPNRNNIAMNQHYFDPMSLVPSLNTPVETNPSDKQIVSELALLTLGAADEDVVGAVLAGSLGDQTMRDKDAVLRALVMLTSMPGYQLC